MSSWGTGTDTLPSRLVDFTSLSNFMFLGRCHSMAEATMQQVQDLWADMTIRLKSDLGDAQWRSWIKPLQAVSLTQGTLTLAASSRLNKRACYQPIS